MLGAGFFHLLLPGDLEELHEAGDLLTRRAIRVEKQLRLVAGARGVSAGVDLVEVDVEATDAGYGKEERNRAGE